MKNLKVLKYALITVGAAGAAVLGMTAGAVVGATMPAISAPDGLTSVDGTPTTPAPAPKYEINTEGLTFGSAQGVPSPAEEPDLILVQTTSGEGAYVFKSELDEANGSNVTSPEEALAWQKAHDGKDQLIPAYKSDGKTVVGDFLIHASTGSLEK